MKPLSDVAARAQDAWSSAWSATEARIRDWVGRQAARKSIEGEIERMLGPIVEAGISNAIRGHQPHVTIAHSLAAMAQESWDRSAPRVQKQFPAEHISIAMGIVLTGLGYNVEGDIVKIEIDLTSTPDMEFTEEDPGALSLGDEDTSAQEVPEDGAQKPEGEGQGAATT
jgi:kynureninase